uniref:Uncharacterized protein n=1 Tax=Astatotilapia calliptera TaxID=8154 RepID=A0AAX7V218_ASTCA
MPGVLGVIARRAAPVLRGHVVAQRASIYTRPAKDKIGSFVSLIYRRTTFDMSRLNVLAAMVCPWLTRSLSVQRSELNVFFVLTETAVGLGIFSLTILGPSGWILAHLEDYKKKE